MKSSSFLVGTAVKRQRFQDDLCGRRYRKTEARSREIMSVGIKFSCHWASPRVSLPKIRLSGKRISWRKEMQLVKLGKKGQVSLPKALLQQVGISGETPLLVDATDDGAIILRQAGVYPIEIYSDERIASFLAEDRMTPAQTAMLNKALKK
jgi:bifunctional DNA-binding transcriptional regulator/antitoxin component of YhaV-PrlF toxin-antitoxin module